MAIVNVSLAHTKDGFIQVDTEKLSPETYEQMLIAGARKLLCEQGRSKYKKPDYEADPNLDRRVAEERLEQAYNGVIKGARKAAGTTAGKRSPERTEAMRIAERKFKDMLKAAKLKISHYPKEQLKAGIEAVFNQDPEAFLNAARESLAKAREVAEKATASGIDLDSILSADAGLIAKDAALKAKQKAKRDAEKAAKAGAAAASTPKKPGPRPQARH